MFGSRHRSVSRQRGILAPRVIAIEILEPRTLLAISTAGAGPADASLESAALVSVSFYDAAAIDSQPSPDDKTTPTPRNQSLDSPINLSGIPVSAGQPVGNDGQVAPATDPSPSDSLSLTASFDLEFAPEPSKIDPETSELLTNPYLILSQISSQIIEFESEAAIVDDASENKSPVAGSPLGEPAVDDVTLSGGEGTQTPSQVMPDGSLLDGVAVPGEDSSVIDLGSPLVADPLPLSSEALPTAPGEVPSSMTDFETVTPDLSNPTPAAAPPEVIAYTPGNLASAVLTSTTVTATFNTSIVSGFSFSLTGPGGIPVESTVDYVDTSRTATLTPTVPLAAMATYTVTIRDATDSAGNILAAPFTWTFMTAAEAPAAPAGGPWDESSVPHVASDPDTSAAELGLKFSSMVAGTVNGVRFYKGAGNTGSHVASLWTSDGTLLATAPFTAETDSGWQQVSFLNPVAVTPGTTYVVSYFAPHGHYAIDVGYFSSGFSTGTLNIPVNAGVFAYSPGSTFPDSTWMSSHYWVDVDFVPASAGTPSSKTVTLNRSDFDLEETGPAPRTLTYTATAQSELFWLDQTYGLYQYSESYDLNQRGQGEKALRGTFAREADGFDYGVFSYYLLPDGDLYQDQTPDSGRPRSILVARLGSTVYNDPSLLWNASNTTVPASLALSSDQLTMTPSLGYEGTFIVVITVSDGEKRSEQPFLVTVGLNPATTDNGNVGDGLPTLSESDLSISSQVDATAGTVPTNLPGSDTEGAARPERLPVVTMARIVPVGMSLYDKALAHWKSQMIANGRQVAAEIHATPGDPGLGLTYYDAARVFQQIADYTGDASWLDAAQDSLTIYRDAYVIPNQGGVPGYWNFTRGLAVDALRTGDAASREAVILLLQNAAFATDAVPTSWTESWELSREVAYNLLARLDAESIGVPHQARTDLLADQALGHLDQWTVSKTATYVRPFMVALTCEALIAYQRQTGDSRVLPAIRTALDWIWANCWNASARSFQYTNITAPDGSGGTEAAPDLNLLIAPAFGWLYHQTGNIIYRDRGDAIFAGGVDQAWLVGAKQFNQNYRWSFAYVMWRAEPPLGS